MTADERLKARIRSMTDDQLRATWKALRAHRIPKAEALVLNPRIATVMEERGLLTYDEHDRRVLA